MSEVAHLDTQGSTPPALSPASSTPVTCGVNGNSCIDYVYRPVDLHDIVSDPDRREKLLPVLDHLIRSQATLHHVEYFGNPDSLEDNVLRKGNTFRGVLLYTKERLPVAYAVYYPMIGENGERGNYVEDAYVVESFRGNGVVTILFNQVAKRSKEEGADFLQWSTDRRNPQFQAVSEQKLGAFHPDLATLVATDLLDPTYAPPASLTDAWKEGRFETVPLEASHVNLIKSMGLSPDVIRKTGDMTFRGFVTFDGKDRSTPVAITLGWPHMSTFRLKHGLYLEHPKFKDNISEQERESIMFSLARSAREYAHKGDFSYLKWHIKKDNDFAFRFLTEKVGLRVDTMVDTPESEMVVYTLKNGKLTALAEKDFSPILRIPNGNSIGAIPVSRIKQANGTDPAPHN